MYPGKFIDTLGDKPAVIVDGLDGPDKILTYRQLEERSRQLSWVFRRAGLKRGDSAALVATNITEVYEFFWACMRTGLHITSINWHLTPKEVAYVANDCGAKVIIVDAELGDLATALLPLLEVAERKIAVNGHIDGYEDYQELLAAESTDEPEDQPEGNFMLYSSGTTGFPKGIKPSLPDRQLGEDNPQLALFVYVYGFKDSTVYLNPAPLYHSAPFRISVYVHSYGGTVVTMKKFDAERCLMLMEKHKATVAQFVPTMFVKMLKLPEEVRNKYDLSSLEIAVHAAAPCPIPAKQAMIEWWGPKILEYYSATEGVAYSAITAEEWLKKPGSVGKDFWIGKPHVVNDDGEEIGPNQIGVLYFENEVQPFSYHNDEEKTKGTFHPDHPTWATVGDVGYIDEDGYLFLTDRQTFMIISGGVNIYPQEVENVLTMHPKVADVAVIGIPHDELGEEVKAIVTPQPGVEPGPELEAELIQYCIDNLAKFKAPRSVDFSYDLPRSDTGKLMKKELQELYRK